MTIGSIGSSALSPFFGLRVRSIAEENPSDTSPAELPAGPLPADLAGFLGQTAAESHLALQIRSRTELRTGSDGSVSERSSTKLRFHYDLTTADGQHIELNVKAKVQQASFQDAAGNSISKTQVRLQFSLLQEGVADDLSPLFSDQVPGDTQSGVSEGLQAFLSTVEDALQDFVDGDSVSADDLVTKTVDTFNTLVDALRQLLFPTAGTEVPPALLPSEQPPVPIPSIEPSLLGGPEPAPATPVSEPSELAAPPAASEENAVTSEGANSAEPLPEEPTVPNVDDPVAPPPEPDSATSPTELANQVLQTVRLRFVQSLTQIIRSWTPEEPSGNGPSAASQRLDYHSALSIRIHTASLVDVNA